RPAKDPRFLAGCSSGVWLWWQDSPVPLFDLRQHHVARQIPDGVVEDLHLDGTTVARGSDGACDAAYLDHAIAHPAARVYRIRDRHQPVIDMEAHDTPRGACDLGVEVGVPPDMIHIDHHAGMG